MHILFLTDNFPPEVNAPASRTFEHCCEWVRLGEQVTVITCAPNFPGGKLLGGYRNRLWQVEYMEGVRVIRVWSYITANEGFVRRTLDYISFMFTAIFASFFVRKVDVIIGTSPQFFTACAAFVVSALKRRPWVFELRDIWPESIRAVGAMKHQGVLDFLEKVELFLYRKASLVVSVTHSFKENLVGRGIDERKIEVVTNGVDLSLFLPREKDQALVDRLGFTDKFVIGYTGTHGMAHGLDVVLNAAELLLDDERYAFLMVGSGAEKERLLSRVEQENIRNVIMLDSVPREQITDYLSILDLAIIHLKRNDLFKTVIPSKLFECMAMGIPVVHGVEGESADIVRLHGVGSCIEPENADKMVRAIKEFTDEVTFSAAKEAGPKAARLYSREQLAAEMLALLKGLLVKGR